MTLDEIKAKRLAPLAAKHAPQKKIEESVSPSGMGVVTWTSSDNTLTSASTVTISGDVSIEGGNTVQFEDVQVEGKKHQTPEFVRHCVAAITKKPETLERVQQKKDGSPFGICYAQYKKNKRSLAAKHSRGKHHTDKDYEQALAKLRNECEELRANKPSRRQIVFESVEPAPRHPRRSVRFDLRG